MLLKRAKPDVVTVALWLLEGETTRTVSYTHLTLPTSDLV